MFAIENTLHQFYRSKVHLSRLFQAFRCSNLPPPPLHCASYRFAQRFCGHTGSSKGGMTCESQKSWHYRLRQCRRVHCVQPYAAAMTIEAGSYPSLVDCSLVIITIGAMQKSVESRLDLIGRNVRILSQIIGCITQTAFPGIRLIVSSPVDILTFEAQRLRGYPASRVLGSGTVLDTSRLKYLTSLPHSSETPSRTLPIPDARAFSASAAKFSLFQ